MRPERKYVTTQLTRISGPMYGVPLEYTTGRWQQKTLGWNTGVATAAWPPAALLSIQVLVVCLNARWRVPIAYYFVESLDAEKRSSITLTTLEKLAEINLHVISITCDGLAAHANIAANMGSNFDVDNFQTQLKNPTIKFSMMMKDR